MKSLIILTLSLLVISSCNRSDGNLYDSPRSDEELKMTLEQREQSSPLKYLSGGELNMQQHQKRYETADCLDRLNMKMTVQQYQEESRIVQHWRDTRI